MKPILLLFALFLTSCSGQKTTKLSLLPHSHHHVTLNSAANGELQILTTGGDPQLIFTPESEQALTASSHILAFEYFCPDGTDFVEVFYSDQAERPNWSQDRQVEGGSLPKAEAWQSFAIDLALGSKGKWKPNQTTIRVDLGRRAGLQIQLRNIHLREATPSEKMSSEEAISLQNWKLEQAKLVDNYLNRSDWPASIETIAVNNDEITISGLLHQEFDSTPYLVEFAPHENPWAANSGSIIKVDLTDSDFEITLPRQSESGKDRIANRFAVGYTANEKGALGSAAIWATDLTYAAERDMPRLRPSNRKGLGGVEFKEGIFHDDLDDLGITASTINIELSGLIAPSPKYTIEYQHQGKTWKFNGPAVHRFDDKIKLLTDKNIVNSAILLVGKEAGILVHPDYNPAGIYSMGNLTSEAACDTYRAVISFLAERYSRPDQAYGWITHWIIFNEVDYGWIWTNMGEQPMSLYMDAYEKAMRLTYIEARRYNPNAEVFISLTHHWSYSPADKFRAYPPRDLLDRLALYSQATGEYQWALAYHPYPQSLLKPRTWEDSKATADFDTRYITPKNIEVLDQYLRQTQFLFEGKPRTIVLSEQGYHTPDYSQKSMLDKAAAIAYTWEKIMPLDSIESFHYHRWVDHPQEGGLKVGLRTLPESGKPFGDRKEPAFSVFSALETEAHGKAIEPFKSIIGIDDWSEIRITPEP